MTPEELQKRMSCLVKSARMFHKDFVFAVDTQTMLVYLGLIRAKENILDCSEGIPPQGIPVVFDRSVTPEQGIKVMLVDEATMQLRNPPINPFSFTCLRWK